LAIFIVDTLYYGSVAMVTSDKYILKTNDENVIY